LTSSAQTFPSMTSQSEILVRLLLWLWVAINTAILVTLLVLGVNHRQRHHEKGQSQLAQHPH
jgi:hypothetical protein